MRKQRSRIHMIHQTSIGENGFKFQELLDLGTFEVIHVHNRAAKNKQDVEEFNDREEAATYLENLLKDVAKKVKRFKN